LRLLIENIEKEKMITTTDGDRWGSYIDKRKGLNLKTLWEISHYKFIDYFS
jgi:hypothetical protein